ncbi:hypothetical protein VTL71DRAFT_15375 [Oculimacula yallundae]|uniref:Uncharacterized protein n=1 Tax=Oculimacula yallundae TaxID=86028 RepID=A0ABR4CGD4_9HELO
MYACATSIILFSPSSPPTPLVPLHNYSFVPISSPLISSHRNHHLSLPSKQYMHAAKNPAQTTKEKMYYSTVYELCVRKRQHRKEPPKNPTLRIV